MSQVAAVLTNAVGNVYVERDGQRIDISIGDEILSTDIIISANNSSAKIEFKDGAIASLSPDSELFIEDFVFGEGQDPSFILNLAQGAMRSLSGEIVKQNPEAFKVVTPNSTAGIRGTELLTVVKGGTEIHVVLELGQGHTVVITASNGRTLVLTAAGQGTNVIDGDLSALTKYELTEQEINDLISSISEALRISLEEENNEITDASSFLLLQGISNALNEEGLRLLSEVLAELGNYTFSDLASGGEDDDLTLSDGNPTPSDDEADTPSEDLSDLNFAGGLVTLVNPSEGYSQYADVTNRNVFFGNDTINISEFKQNVEISGDAMTTSGSTATAGSDIINITGDMEDGAVSGDVFEITGGQVIAGDDEIVINGSKTGGNTIYGDAKSISGSDSKLTTGNDVITITGALVAGQNIYGDVKEVLNGAQVTGSAADTISVGINDGNIYGDAQTVDTSSSFAGGNDSIIVTTNNGNIYASAGNDTIQITNQNAGLIEAGAGDDSITVQFYAGGIIDGGAGVDTLDIASNFMTGSVFRLDSVQNIESFSFVGIAGGTIEGTASGELITLASMSGATGAISAFGGQDTIHITGDLTGGNIYSYASGGAASDNSGSLITVDGIMQNAAIHGDSGADSINLEDVETSTIYGNYGSDSIYVDGNLVQSNIYADDGTYTETDNNTIIVDGSVFRGSSINGAAGADSIRIGLDFNGTINGGAGADSIVVDGNATGTPLINGGAGSDTIIVETLASGAIYAYDGTGNTETDSNTITIKDAAQGSIYGSDGIDNISVGTFLNADIYGYGGADIIEIGAQSQRIIDAGDGNDSVSIGSYAAGSINGGAGTDTLTITDDITNNTSLSNFSSFEEINLSQITNNAFVTGTTNDDFIRITEFVSGTYDSNGGSDDIIITNAFTGNVTVANNSAVANSIYFENGFNGNLTLTGIAGFNLYGTYATTGTSNFNMTGGILNAGGGNDTFNIDAFSGGTIDTGNGNDLLIFNSAVTGGTINNSGGNDTIILKEDGIAAGSTLTIGTVASNGTLTPQNTAGLATFKLSQGTLAIGQAMSGVGLNELSGSAKLSGISNTTSYNIDVENMSGVSGSEPEINTLGGRDTISITNMTGFAELDTGDGDDSIQVTTISGYNTFIMGVGNDTLTINSSMSDGYIDMGAGVDEVNIDIFNGGTLNTGTDNDIISLDSMGGGTLNTGTGADNVTITNQVANDVTITNSALFGSGVDNVTLTGGIASGTTVTLTGNAGFNVIFTNYTDGDLYTSDGADSISINTMSSGTIYGNSGADTISIANISGGNIYGHSSGGSSLDDGNTFVVTGQMVNSSLNGAEGNDSITVGTLALNGAIYGHGGVDSIKITTMNGGSINAGEGNNIIDIDTVTVNAEIHIVSEGGIDNITIGTLTDNNTNNINITTGSNNDTLTITTMSGTFDHVADTIDTGDGDDVINITSLNATGVNIRTGTGADNVTITNNVTQTFTITNSFGLTDGVDNIAFTGGIASGVTVALAGDAGFNVNFADYNGATLNTSDGADSITITSTMTGGTIATGAGNDSINITGFSQGTVNAGTGTNTVTASLSQTVEASAPTINFEGLDTVYLTHHSSVTGSAVYVNFENYNVGNSLNVNGTLYDNNSMVTAGVGQITLAQAVNQGLTVTIDDINISFGTTTRTPATTNGSVDYSADNLLVTNESITSNKDYISHELKISGDVTTGLTISGDAINIENSTANTYDVVFGHDIITKNVNDIDVYGTIVGDVSQVNTTGGGVLNLYFGSDIIETANLIGGKISGDSFITSGNVIVKKYGNDSITINGNVELDTVNNNSSVIYGDSFSGGGGNDTITVNGNVIGGAIYGDSESGGTGSNVIHVTGNLETYNGLTYPSGEIHGGDGDDSIIVDGNIVGYGSGGSSIHANAGNDTITIGGDTTYGNIDGGTGNDSITVGDMVQSNIDAGAGDDIITAGTLSDYTEIYGRSGADSITVTDMFDGAEIYAGDGADTVVITGLTNNTEDSITVYLSDYNTADGQADLVQITNTSIDTEYISISNFEAGTDSIQVWNGTDWDTLTVNQAVSEYLLNGVELKISFI